MTSEKPTPARRLWQAIEPIHGVAYYAPEPLEASRSLGLIGYWMGYFANRLAPAGPLDAPAAQALSFAFAPRRVARALPDAWAYTTPEARLWLAATVLREHRGDGHVISVVHHGLSGLEAGVTHVASGTVGRELIQGTRGWTDDEWDQAGHRLAARGLLDRDGKLTRAGWELRHSLENATDRLAADPVTRLGASGIEEAIDLALPVARRITDEGLFLAPNPLGMPRP